MSNIFLIRHGFTPANNANYNNQRGLWKIATDSEMPLEKKYGEEQARELGVFLNSFKGKILFFVSPYRRAMQTLELALSEISNDYQVMICDELHENDSGIHYAKTKDEVLEMNPEAQEYYLQFEGNPFETPYLGGESDYDVRDRVEEISYSILEMSEKDEYDYIIVLAHGTVNKWIYYWLNGELLADRQKNCEVIVAKGEEIGKSIFLPVAWVPKGYQVKIKSYLS